MLGKVVGVRVGSWIQKMELKMGRGFGKWGEGWGEIGTGERDREKEEESDGMVWNRDRIG